MPPGNAYVTGVTRWSPDAAHVSKLPGWVQWAATYDGGDTIAFRVAVKPAAKVYVRAVVGGVVFGSPWDTLVVVQRERVQRGLRGGCGV